MAPRAQWKGFLKLSLVSCPIALYPATAADAKVSFRQVNRDTGNRLKQQMIDSVTGEVVEGEQKAKGFEIGKDQYIVVDKSELEDLQVDSTHTIEIDHFVPREQIDTRWIDKPYYLAPDGDVGQDAYAVIREAMRQKGVVGIGRVVLSTREHPIMLEPLGKGIRAATLRYPVEVRAEEAYFEGVSDEKVQPDLLKLAGSIVANNTDDFDPNGFTDTYEAALVEMLRAKKAGKPQAKAGAAKKKAGVVNLMDALRASVDGGKKKNKKAA
jgi:DNA end-binding protein Ku